MAEAPIEVTLWHKFQCPQCKQYQAVGAPGRWVKNGDGMRKVCLKCAEG